MTENENIETGIDELNKARYIMYFYSRKHLMFRFLKDFSDKNEWKYQDKLYILDEPSCYYKGSPCYVVFKEDNLSSRMEFNLVSNCLTEKGYSPADVQAKLNSAYLQRIHNYKKTFIIKYALMVAIWSALLVITTVLICQNLWVR